MKKMVIRAISLVTLILMCGGGISPCLAYYAPLTNITGPTVTQDTETKVTVSVHNPATGQDIPYTWTIAGGASAFQVDQERNNQGMVAWRVKDLSNNKYQIVVGVYDPNPEMGWQFSTNWDAWLDHETNILSLHDGVLLYESKYTPETPSWENPSVIVDYFATYDPGLEMPDFPWRVGWRWFSYSFTDYSGGNSYGHVVEDGVVAYIYTSPSMDYVLVYGIFDSGLHGWWVDDANPHHPSLLSIANATVTWNDSILGDQKRGYDHNAAEWQDGVDTKVLANFVFAPLAPKVNQPVYFTDMSIAATVWNYDLGDSSSRNDRSFYHRYAKPGDYLVNQQVTGPAGADANAQNVLVKGSGNAALMLLLDN
jgi:hypothetical protein